jgi:hypothetical protein
MIQVDCPYCGGIAEFVDSKEVYGRSCGMIYLCRPCKAYVGTHNRSNKPLGRLANAELRRLRNAAHSHFDPIWKQGRFKGRRNAAYQWLAKKMDLTVGETHIAMFDVEQCRSVVEIMINERNKNHGKQRERREG